MSKAGFFLTRLFAFAFVLGGCLTSSIGQVQGIYNQGAQHYLPPASAIGNRIWMTQAPATSDGQTQRTGIFNVGNTTAVANPRALLVNYNCTALSPNNRYDQAAASSLTSVAGCWLVPVAGPFTVSSSTNTTNAVVTFSGSPGWGTNQFLSSTTAGAALGTYMLVKLTGNSDYWEQIDSNTSNTITLHSVYGTAPSSGDTMMVFQRVQWTFSGSTSTTLTSGSSVWTDPVKFVAPYGGLGQQLFYAVTTTVPTSATVYDALSTNTANLEAGFGGADRTFPTSSTIGSARVGFGYGAAPACVRIVTGVDLGRSGQKAAPIALVGDSLTMGTNANVANIPTIGFSALQRALINAGVQYVNLGASGEMAQYAAADGLSGRLAALTNSSATTAVLSYGRNDFSTSLGTPRTAAQIEADLTTLVGLLSGNGFQVVFQTLPPYTTSSDSWVTTANQAVTANEATRLAVNTWMLTGAGSQLAPVFGTIDLATACTIIRTSDGAAVWRPNGTSDGTHPGEGLIETLARTLDISVLLSRPLLILEQGGRAQPKKRAA